MLPSPPERPNSHSARGKAQITRVVVDVICAPMSRCICLLYCSCHQKFGHEAYSIANYIVQECPGSRYLALVLTYHSSCCTNQETLLQDITSYCSHSALQYSLVRSKLYRLCHQQLFNTFLCPVCQNKYHENVFGYQL